MKLHSKTIFVILGTLVIGLLVGALGQSSLHNRRMEKIAEMRRQGGLYDSVDRYIDAIDRAQEDTLRAVVMVYQEKLERNYRRYRWHRRTVMDSLKSEILPLLTEQQIEDITPWFDRNARRPDASRRDSTSVAATRPDSSSGG